jgi:quercetin dioxygenase-like cupin family protein
MMTNTFLNMPYALAYDQGKRIYSFGELLTVVKASSEQTGGAFNLFEVTCSQGYSTPLHIHYAEDVAVFVLEGALTVLWGSEKKQADAGSYFYQPRGIPHGFRVEGTTPARLLYLTFPGGMDRFVSEQGTLFPHCNECVVLAARHKIEILGALPQ